MGKFCFDQLLFFNWMLGKKVSNECMVLLCHHENQVNFHLYVTKCYAVFFS